MMGSEVEKEKRILEEVLEDRRAVNYPTVLEIPGEVAGLEAEMVSVDVV